MILPELESDLRMNILVLGNELLDQLIRKKEILIENLLTEFLEKDVKRTPNLFVETITILYAIGLIDIKDYKIRVVPYDKTQTTLFRNRTI